MSPSFLGRQHRHVVYRPTHRDNTHTHGSVHLFLICLRQCSALQTASKDTSQAINTHLLKASPQTRPPSTAALTAATEAADSWKKPLAVDFSKLHFPKGQSRAPTF